VPGIQLGWTDILPVECSCNNLIRLYNNHPVSRWEEADCHRPKIGDLMLYAFNDSATDYSTTDNQAIADHIGIVCAVGGDNIDVLEGNYSRSVKIRKMKWNGRFIRGYALPAFHLKVQEGLTVGQYEELKTENIELRKSLEAIERRVMPRFQTLEEVPEWGQSAIRDAIARNILTGVNDDKLSLSWSEVRAMEFDHRRENAK